MEKDPSPRCHVLFILPEIMDNVQNVNTRYHPNPLSWIKWRKFNSEIDHWNHNSYV